MRSHLTKLIIIFLVLSILKLEVFAQGNATLPPNGEYDIVEDLQILEKETCSTHNFFYQVAAQEDGCFAVLSRQANNTNLSGGTMSVAYIDLFDSTGVFQKELVFSTPLDFVIEYESDTLNLYFYDHYISYNIPTGSATRYTSSDNLLSEKKASLTYTRFTSGLWQYRCTRSFHGFTKLTRTNSVEEQVLLDLPGSGINIWNTVFLAIGLAILTIFWKKQKTRILRPFFGLCRRFFQNLW